MNDAIDDALEGDEEEKVEWNSNFGGHTSVETWIHIYLVRLNVSANNGWPSFSISILVWI
jgi:hypothetical protein